MNKATKLISSAVIGTDVAVFTVNSKQYVVQPPTIHKMAGAIHCLSDLDLPDNATVKDMLMAIGNIEVMSGALSWFIVGDSSLSEDLSHGSMEEVVNGLEMAISLIPYTPFLKAVNLARNVAKMAAKPR